MSSTARGGSSAALFMAQVWPVVIAEALVASPEPCALGSWARVKRVSVGYGCDIQD